MHPLKGRKQTSEHIANRVESRKKTPVKLRDTKSKLLSKVEVNEVGCWVWQGAVFKKPHGNYGMIRMGRRGDNKTYRAHIVSYKEFVGEIPQGLELDHLCRNTLCINPTHLEPVTHTENMRRRIDINKSHCKHGHQLTAENLYIKKNGARECRICKRQRSRESAQRKYARRRLEKQSKEIISTKY